MVFACEVRENAPYNESTTYRRVTYTGLKQHTCRCVTYTGSILVLAVNECSDHG